MAACDAPAVAEHSDCHLTHSSHFVILLRFHSPTIDNLARHWRMYPDCALVSAWKIVTITLSSDGPP
jgi:hypothetical protein